MDFSLRRPQIYWSKELPPKLNIDNHPDLPPSKSPADFYGDTRKRNHHQSKKLESAEKAWLHTLPWSYADVVINKPRRLKVNNQDNVEFKNSCFSNMIWKSAESNDQAPTEEVNSESSEGDSFLNPNANEFVPEIQSNDDKDTASQSYEEKIINDSSKDTVTDDDGTTQEQYIASESYDSYTAEEISVNTRSNDDETTVQEDIESTSQTNTIYEVPDLDKQNVEINTSAACEEESIVIDAEGEIDTTSQNQLIGAELINDCDKSEIQQTNEEQDDESSHKSQVEQTDIETNLGFEISSKHVNENEELADERQDINLEPKSIGSDQAEFECQSLGSKAQAESETPELDNANMEQIESGISTNYTEAQIESDDLESNNIDKTQTESEEIPKSDPIKEAQPGSKPEEPYNEGESIAESEFSETVIPSEAQASSEILEPYNAAQFQEVSEIQDSYNVTQLQAESKILDESIGSEAHAASEIQEPYNAAQLEEELEIQDSNIVNQLQAESEILDASIASQTQVVSEIQESYNAPKSQEESEIQEPQSQEELKIQEYNNASKIQEESEVQESYQAIPLEEELEIQESYQAIPLEEESEVQESYQATPLQEESGVQESYQATPLQEESDVQESYQATPMQEESGFQESYQATPLQEESGVQESYQATPLQEESEVQESYHATPSQEESEVQDSIIVGKTLDESDQSGSSKFSHDRSEETVLNKSSDSNYHAVTEKGNISLKKQAKEVTDSDKIKSVQDHLGNNKISSDAASHQDVDKENTTVAPEQPTTKKNKKRRNKKKNKVNNQLNSGLDFDELVKDKTNYSEKHSNIDESTSSTGHQSAETNQSHREQEAELMSKSAEINEEQSVMDNGKTKDLNDESCQNNIVDDENNVIEFKNEHFDINEVDKFIEEEQKALAEFPNELDVENQIILEEELADIVLPKQNDEEQEENISNEVKEETNNQNDDVVFDKDDSAIIKDDAVSLAGSSDHESSFEIINENAFRDDVNQSSQDLLIDDENLDENEIKNKNNEVLSPTVTISSEISSIPQEDNVENHTYNISVPKELDINKNETVMNTEPLEQNDEPLIAGIDNTTENEDISMQEDHFSKPVETMSETISNERFDAAQTIGEIDDGEIAQKGETVILNENIVNDESVNYENKETPIITERSLLLPHDAVTDDKIVGYVTQIEKSDVMNGEECPIELPNKLEIKNSESNLLNNEVPKTKKDNANGEAKSKICSDLERNEMNKSDEIPTEQFDETKNEETSSRSRIEEKSDLSTSYTDFEPKVNEDHTMSDVTDENTLKEIINKLPTRVTPTSITEIDVESPAIQELSTIAEITERTVSELPDDNTSHIAHPESDVEISEKIMETIKSQLEEGISNESEKSFIRTEYENSNSSQRGDETLSPENLTDSEKGDQAKNKITVSAAIKPKSIDIKTTSKSAPKVPAKTSSKPTTTSSKPATTAGATKLSSASSVKAAPGTSKLASTSTIKTAKPLTASAKLAAADVAKQAAGTVKSSTSSVKQVTAVSKSAAPGSPKPTATKTATGTAIKIGSKAASPAKPSVTTIKIAIKAAPKAAGTKPTTPPGKTVAAVKPPTPPLKISLTTKPSTPPKPAKTTSRPTTATKPLTPTSKANLAAAISLPAKPDSSTNSTTSTIVKKPSTPTSKSVEKSSLKTSSASSKPSSATKISSVSSKTPQPIKKPTSNSPKPAATPTKATSESPTKTPVKNSTEPTKTIVKSLSEQSKSTKTSSSSSNTKISTTDKTKTPSSPKTSTKSAVTVKKTPTSVKDKTAKSQVKTDDKNVKKSIKTSSNKDHQTNEKNGTLNEVSSTTDYISSDGLSQLSELIPQIIV